MSKRAAVLAIVGVLSLVAAGEAAALDRTSTDRPDEAVGPQVHLVYALPSDAQDGALDTNGTIGSWMAGFNDWLAAGTGGVKLRIDTSAGQPDVSFIRLLETDATLTGQGSAANDTILGELRAAGLADPNKAYAVVEEGGSDACGWGGGGRPLGVLYLHACSGVAWQYVMGHELFHVFGAVNSCAPHYAEGHVADTEVDLMYRFAYRGIPMLDPGHDDYYGPPGDDHLPVSCPSSANVANSLFLTSHPFYRLSVAIQGNGAVSLPGVFVCTPVVPAGCAPALEGGTDLQLVGVADGGSHFVGWSGGGCSGTGECDRTLDGDMAVTAMFAANPTTRVVVQGKGRVNVQGAGACAKAACSLTIAYNRATTMRAVPAKHWRFRGWAGACKGKTPTCTVKATASVTVRAVFGRS